MVWIGQNKLRINSYFESWRNDSPRTKGLLLYGTPGCGKTSSALELSNAKVIHRNCSAYGSLNDIQEVLHQSQLITDVDGNRIVILLDEIEGLTKQSLELMNKILTITKVPIIMTCNMDYDSVNSMVYKHKWNDKKNTLVEMLEIEYPLDEVPDLLMDIIKKEKGEIPESYNVSCEIANKCNSVRSAILTLHRYLQRMDLKIEPIDIDGSDHEKIRKILIGEDPSDDYIKPFVDYCLANIVPADQVMDYVMLEKMSRESRLAKVEIFYRNNMRSINKNIMPPKHKSNVFFYKPKNRKEKVDDVVTKRKKEKDRTEDTVIKLETKVNLNLDDVW